MIGPIPLVGHVVPLMAMTEPVASASSALEGFTVVSLDGGVRDPWARMEAGRLRGVVNGLLGCQNWVVGTQLTGPMSGTFDRTVLSLQKKSFW